MADPTGLQVLTVLAVLESPAGQRAIRTAVDARLRDVVKALSRHQDLCMRTIGVFNASYIGAAILNMLNAAPREPAQERPVTRAESDALGRALRAASERVAQDEPAQEQEGNWALNTTTTRPALEPAQERQEAPEWAALASEFAGYFERHLYSRPGSVAEQELRQFLWDNKAALLARLTTPTPDPLLPGLRAALYIVESAIDEGCTTPSALKTLRAEIARREGGQ